ncbi:SRPBCC family protein [Chthonobacter albigriseus]|uniref:SRPBCC family protein n=1 Tax=Chthonobacter albigriseus TaxID=1683161 RepID=UPI0015EEB4B5|nr:SRPBCC family protein [Chthonobacter albigriseus]
MATPVDVTPTDDLELAICRILDVPREKLFKAWTTPELLKQFWCPLPWTTPEAHLDVRTGGSSVVVMRSPEGEEQTHRGVYLEVVPNEKIVFTDAFTSAWAPSDKPFMVGIITFEDAGAGRTRYTARARHWTTEDRNTHDRMGFHEGWGAVAEQLERVAAGA